MYNDLRHNISLEPQYSKFPTKTLAMDDDSSLIHLQGGGPHSFQDHRISSIIRSPREESVETRDQRSHSAPTATVLAPGRPQVYAGTLVKKGHIWKAWKKRYFVLQILSSEEVPSHRMQSSSASSQPGRSRSSTIGASTIVVLRYYRHESHKSCKGEIRLSKNGQSNILWIRTLDIQQTGRPYCFQLRMKGFYTLVCQGCDEQDVNEWMSHLQPFVRFPLSNTPMHVRWESCARKKSDGGLAEQQLVAAEVCRILDHVKSPERFECTLFHKSIHHQGSISVKQLYSFIISIRNLIFKNHGNQIRKSLEDCDGEEDLEIQKSAILSIIFKQVEELIFFPVYDIIYISIRKQCVNDDEEQGLNQKIYWLQGREQRFFGIELSHYSWNGWSESTEYFIQMNACSLPSDKINALITALESIQQVFHEQHYGNAVLHNRSIATRETIEEENEDAEKQRLATRHFISILTFVLVNAGCQNLLTLHALLKQVVDIVGKSTLNDGKMKKKDENATVCETTALSMLKAAIEHLEQIRIPPSLEKAVNDQITISINSAEDWTKAFELNPEPNYRLGAVIHKVNISPNHSLPDGLGLLKPGLVLVSISGTPVILWPFSDIIEKLTTVSTRSIVNGGKEAKNTLNRLAFITSSQYIKQLEGKYGHYIEATTLWNDALLRSSMLGNQEAVERILQQEQVDINCQESHYHDTTQYKNTPLHLATTHLHLNIVNLLLQKKARVNAIGPDRQTALHMVGKGTSHLSGSSPSFSRSCNSTGTSSVVVSIIQTLLYHGAQVNTVDIHGNTPLMTLAKRGQVDSILALLPSIGKCPSNLHLQSIYSPTDDKNDAGSRKHPSYIPDHSAHGEKHAVIPKVSMRNWNQGQTCLFLAAAQGHPDIVSVLLDYGGNPNVSDFQGETPLHIASAIACTKTCQILIEKGGASVNKMSKYGFSPLAIAISRGRLQQQVRTAPSCSESKKKKGIIHIDDSSVLETVKLLIQHHAGVDNYCREFKTILHYAALYGNTEGVQFLLSQGVNPNALDIYGHTALDLVMIRRQQLLGLNIREEGNQCPHHLCSEYYDIALVLRKANCNLNSTFAINSKICALEEKNGEMRGTGKIKSNGIIQFRRRSAATLEKAQQQECEVVGGTRRGLLEALITGNSLSPDENEEWYHIRDLECLLLIVQPRYALEEICSSIQHIYDTIHAIGDTDQHRTLNYLRRLLVFISRWMELCHIQNICGASSTDKVGEHPNQQQLFEAIVQRIISETTHLDSQVVSWMKEEKVFEMDSNHAFTVMQHSHSAILPDYANMALLLSNDDDIPVHHVNEKMVHLDDDPASHRLQRLHIAGVVPDIIEAKSANEMTPNEGGRTSRRRRRRRRLRNLSRSFDSASSSFHKIEKPNRWQLALDPLEIAQQITLYQHFYFQQIPVSAFLNPPQARKSRSNSCHRPMYEKLKSIHKHIALLVMNEVLSCGEDRSKDGRIDRAFVLGFYIQVAYHHLFTLNNFDGFMAIYSGLEDSSIFRLKRTWKGLSPEASQQYKRMAFFGAQGARHLNGLMREVDPPALPYLGLVFQNLLNLQEYPDTCVPAPGDDDDDDDDGKEHERMLNFQKIRARGNVLNELIRPFQDIPYIFPVNAPLLQFIRNPLKLTTKDMCFETSLEIEPRE